MLKPLNSHAVKLQRTKFDGDNNCHKQRINLLGLVESVIARKLLQGVMLLLKNI